MAQSHRPPGYRFSRDGFERIERGNTPPTRDATINIPMEQVHASHNNASGSDFNTPVNEKSGLFHRVNPVGARRSMQPGLNAHGGQGTTPPPVIDEDRKLNGFGHFYKRFTGFSIVTKYFVFFAPLAIILAIPIAIGATVERTNRVDGVNVVWIFTWAEVAWCGLWVSKIFAHTLPYIFMALCGVVSSGVRKYAEAIRKLEIPISLVGWALISLSTWNPILTENPDVRQDKANAKPPGSWKAPHWESVVEEILAAALVASLIFLAEKVLIQLLAISFHRKQFTAKIKDSKHAIHLLGLLYGASIQMFPRFCPEFAEEDAAIADQVELNLGGKHRRDRSHQRSGSATPMRMLGAFGDKVASAVGNVAHEVTGKDVFNSNSSHSIVIEALEKNKTADALARRLWLSFVIEGHDALYLEDVIEVLGQNRQAEAEECFAALDRDSNGDVSLDEMIMTVIEMGRERHSISSSLHDVSQAINVLDQLLCVVVFVIVVLVFVAFLYKSFVGALATAGTALLSMSFVFSTSAQELLGSCIFLFSKHPFDVGDRVEITSEQMTVQHISLLFSVFKKISTNQVVQIPNIVLNTLWIENVSRSLHMREKLKLNVDFATTFDDVQTLRAQLIRFVTDKENSRDFHPEVDVQVTDVSDMSKMELTIEVMHKSNWANETVRAARRSKFMCALVLAIRRVPIAGPGGAAPALGDPANPSYSVTISDTIAKQNKVDKASAADAARLYPIRNNSTQNDSFLNQTDGQTQTGSNNAGQVRTNEQRAVSYLNERNLALDGARDDVAAGDRITSMRLVPNAAAGSDRVRERDIDEIRGLLKQDSNKGRRKSARSDNGPGGAMNGVSLGQTLTNNSFTSPLPQIGVTGPEGGYAPTLGQSPPKEMDGSLPGPSGILRDQHEKQNSEDSVSALPQVPPPPVPVRSEQRDSPSPTRANAPGYPRPQQWRQ